MLRYKILFALAITVAGPALAGGRTEYGEVDGRRFEYTPQIDGKGIIHLAGLIHGSGERFDLTVDRYGHVEGHFGYSPVQYDVGKKLRDQVAAGLDRGVVVAQATPHK